MQIIRPSIAILALLSGLELSAFGPAALRTGHAQSAKPRVRVEMLVSTNWLAEHLGDSKVVILHVAREKSNYDDGHIPSAIFLPWSEMVTTRDGVANELPSVDQLERLFTRLGIGNTARIILYGDSLSLSAMRAYFTLDYLGQGHRTAILDGGIEKWKTEGQKISKEEGRPVEAAFTPAVNPQVVTDLKGMRDYSARTAGGTQAHLAIVDGRPEEQFIGDPASSQSGHIPGAVSLFWVNQIASRESPTLLSQAELQSLFEKAGVAEGDKIVTYCNSGVQASHSYFVAKYLGYEASMYDGSFSEWIKAEGTKVTKGKNPK